MMNWGATRGFARSCASAGERYVLGVPCTTTMRDLEAPLPAYQGRGRRPKAPVAIGDAVAASARRGGVDAVDGTRRGERAGGDRDGQAPRADAMERKRTGPEEWLVVTRRPLADDGTLEARASRDATDQDARYRYQYYLTPTYVSEAELEEPSLAELARVIKAGAVH